MKSAMIYFDEDGGKIGNGLKHQDMMEVEAGNKLAEFGRQRQSQADKRITEVLDEINKVESQLFKIGKDKKLKT